MSPEKIKSHAELVPFFRKEQSTQSERKVKNIASAASAFLREIFFFLTLSLFLACSKEKPAEKVPPEIISFDSMITVMADMHLAETRMLMGGLSDSAAKAKQASHYKFVFEKNKIDNIRFKNSFEYYNSRISLMNNLYEKVIHELSKRQAEVEK